jgi:predicted GIY-YIG superfamily endonuclease
MAMHYVYILWSSKSKNFYYGYSDDLAKRFSEHNKGIVKSTAPYRPWRLVTYLAFDNQKSAKDFERYLKSGSGKAFTYKRLVNSEALKKDSSRDDGIPKS